MINENLNYEVLDLDEASMLIGETIASQEADLERLSTARQLAYLAVTNAESFNELNNARTHLRVLNSLNSYIENEMESGHLRPHQKPILESLRTFLEEPAITPDGGVYRRGRIKMPTGTGKTPVYGTLLKALAHTEPGVQPVRSLILVPRLSLSDYVIGDSDNKTGLAHFAPEVNVTEFNGVIKDLSGDAVVMTYDSFMNTVDSEEFRAQNFGLIICDEAHRTLGEKRFQKLDAYLEDKIAIGLTATPDYSVDKRVEHLFATPIHDLDLRESIELGLLAPVRCLIHTTDVEIPKISSTTEFSAKELEKLIKLDSRNRDVIELSRQFIEGGRKGIISCVPGGNNLHAKYLAEELNKVVVTLADGTVRNIVAESVGSHLSREENRKILQRAKNGEIDVLTNVYALAEGWDNDQVSFFINACPTTSIAKLTQQIGRVMRLKADGLSSIVVDFIDRAVGRQQCTALQVLGEDTFSLEKVIGTPSESEIAGIGDGGYITGLLNSELLANLIKLDGKLVRDITILHQNPHNERLSKQDKAMLAQQRKNEREIQKWEKVLAAEGMPAELGVDTMGLPVPFQKEFHEAYKRVVEQGIIRPTHEDIYENMRKDRALLGLKKGTPMVKHFVEHVMGIQATAGRLVEHFDDGFGYGVVSSSEDFTATIVNDIAVNDALYGALDQLNERERHIIITRYGLDSTDSLGMPKTLDETGRQMNLTRERVRQVEIKALWKLRSHLYAEKSIFRDEGIFTRHENKPPLTIVEYESSRGSQLFKQSREADFSTGFYSDEKRYLNNLLDTADILKQNVRVIDSLPLSVVIGQLDMAIENLGLGLKTPSKLRAIRMINEYFENELSEQWRDYYELDRTLDRVSTELKYKRAQVGIDRYATYSQYTSIVSRHLRKFIRQRIFEIRKHQAATRISND